MSQYQEDIHNLDNLKAAYGAAWGAISPESAARMKA